MGTLQEDELHKDKLLDKIIADVQIFNSPAIFIHTDTHKQHKQHNNSNIIRRSEVISPEISRSEIGEEDE